MTYRFDAYGMVHDLSSAAKPNECPTSAWDNHPIKSLKTLLLKKKKKAKRSNLQVPAVRASAHRESQIWSFGSDLYSLIAAPDALCSA